MEFQLTPEELMDLLEGRRKAFLRFQVKSTFPLANPEEFVNGIIKDASIVPNVPKPNKKRSKKKK